MMTRLRAFFAGVIACGCGSTAGDATPDAGMDVTEESDAGSEVEEVGTAALNLSFRGSGDGQLQLQGLEMSCNRDCSVELDVGTEIELEAVAGPDASFVGFLGDSECEDGVVTLDKARSCTAVFSVATADPCSSLGDEGVMSADFGAAVERFRALQLSSDKYLLAADVGDTLIVQRFDYDGLVDSSFGDGGTATHPITSDFMMTDLVEDKDGALFVLGHNEGLTEAAVVKLHEDGRLDETFGESAWSRWAPPDLGTERIETAAILPTDDAGGLLLVGTIGELANNDLPHDDVYVIRLDAAGAVDGEYGMARIDPSNYYRVRGAALQSDGKIVIGGHDLYADAITARMDASGALDTSFGDNGITDSGTFYFNHIALDDDDNILLSGYHGYFSSNTAHGSFFTASVDGAPVDTFSGDGLVLSELEGNHAFGKAHRGLSGYYVPVAGNTFTLLRYLPEGTVDSSFGTEGVASMDLGTSIGNGQSLGDAYGRFVFAGASSESVVLGCAAID